MPNILVVDDDPEIVAIIQLAFEYNRPEYTLCGAYDGGTALDSVENDKYDLLILDVSMPDPDGFEITKRVRQFSDVPIVLLTGMGMVQDKARGIELGANDYITKPFSHKELIGRVDIALRRSLDG